MSSLVVSSVGFRLPQSPESAGRRLSTYYGEPRFETCSTACDDSCGESFVPTRKAGWCHRALTPCPRIADPLCWSNNWLWTGCDQGCDTGCDGNCQRQ
eukprot:4115885-Prymnesium_polylepis.1